MPFRKIDNSGGSGWQLSDDNMIQDHFHYFAHHHLPVRLDEYRYTVEFTTGYSWTVEHIILYVKFPPIFVRDHIVFMRSHRRQGHFLRNGAVSSV